MAELIRRINDIEQIFEASDIEDATAHELWNEYEWLSGCFCSMCLQFDKLVG